ncbi:MAG: peptidoglycan DD-metalloendopeptidase family protein [Tannerellaceae bacterium]
MNIRTLLFIGCSIVMVAATKAEEPQRRQTSKQSTHAKQMDKHVTELMADRVGFKKDIALKELAEMDEKKQLAEEDLMFPADELYGSNWDNRWVNPFRNSKVVFPDSCSIDCSTFTLPIQSEIRVTSNFGPRRRRMHKGIDLKVQIGDTIRAAFDGKIRIINFERRGYGNYVVIRHPNGLETIYGHLSKFLVDVNEIVRAGTPIALGGNTGRSTGSHLHFETRFLGEAINPANIIDFVNGVPHQDMYVFHNMRINGRNSNVYTSSNGQMAYHRVKSGDTLGAIARRYGTSVRQLCRLNGLKPTSTLRLGQSLRCSEGGVSETKTARSKKQTAAPQIVKTTVEATAAAVASLPENAAANQSTEAVYHRVKSGDTLGAIASKYGISIRKICQLNGISKTTILKLGRSLRCS